MLIGSMLTQLMTTLAGIGFLGQMTALLNIPIILLKIIGFSTFRVRNDRDRIKALLKLLNEETYSTATIFEYGKERPAGMFIGWNCFGYYSDISKDAEYGTEVVVFTSNKNFKSLMDRCVTPCESLCLAGPQSTQMKPLSSPINIWHRYGSYVNIYYQNFKVDMANITPIGCQAAIVQDILEKYGQMKRLTVFIQGYTGTGKSTIGLLVAKELRGSYCHEFNPTDPGDSFKTFLRDSESVEDKGPLVIVLEEVDTLIRKVHDGTVLRHKNITTAVHNKTTFNSFLDDMIFYKNTIIIMTSNVSKVVIDKIDPSYLRKGRVNEYYNMVTPLVEA